MFFVQSVKMHGHSFVLAKNWFCRNAVYSCVQQKIRLNELLYSVICDFYATVMQQNTFFLLHNCCRMCCIFLFYYIDI